ncbi:MAG: hypothetical protein RL441_1059 [Actinomycetota bacterium]
MHRLVLMRHAKSDWPAGFDDIDRPLSKRGIADAGVAGEYLGTQDWQIGFALVSVAQRTRETFANVSSTLGYDVRHSFENSIYDASPGEILSLVRAQVAETVLVIGHAPGIPRLALGLAMGELPNELLRGKGYPTAAISVLESDQPWSAWEPECARFVDYHVPRADPLSDDSD